MTKKSQNETNHETKESLTLEWNSTDLRPKLEQADNDAQTAYDRVVKAANRFIEINQLVKTASSDDRKTLFLERQNLQIELETLPYEAGAAMRAAILAKLTYLKAEEQRIIKWESRLDDENYYNPEKGEYEYPDSFDVECEAKEQTKQDWQQLVLENGLSSGYWQLKNWRNESLWEEYALLRQEDRTKVSLSTRDSILNGTWGTWRDPLKEAQIFKG